MKHDPHDMVGYYARRAEEYEEVYNHDDLRRRAAQAKISRTIRNHLKERHVLELACGTGYWTKSLSHTAKSIVATDINKEVMEVAKKRIFHCDVTFQQEDIYKFSFDENTFSGGMSHFLFSHIPKSEIHGFLQRFHKVLKPGATVIISDDMQSPLDNPILKPKDNNTYSERQLTDGSKYLILKNFFNAEELVSHFKEHVPHFTKKNISMDNYYWYVKYEVPK